MKLIDLTDQFYAPVWIRVAVVVVLAGWGLVELVFAETVWAVISLSLAAICAWRFATIDYRIDADK